MRPLPPSCQPGLDAWNLFVIKRGNDRVARETSCDLQGLSGWGPSLGQKIKSLTVSISPSTCHEDWMPWF